MLSATLLLALPSPPARAQTRRLATAAVSLDAVAADAAWGLLGMRAGARADPRFEVLDLASVGPDRSEWLERARAPLPASLKSFDQMDFAAAQEKADLALAAAANADWTSLATRAAFLDATAARILALHGRNQRAALKSELAGLFAVDPAYQIDSRRCGPELTSASEKVRAAVNRGRVARAELRSLPAGASVWLDGVFRGISPVQVKDLPPGLHFVALRLDGYKPTQVKVLFGTAVPVEVALELSDAGSSLRALLQGIHDSAALDAVEPAAAKLAAWADADEAMVLVTGSQGDLRNLELVRVGRDGRLLARLNARTNADNAALAEVARGLAKEALAKPLPAAAVPPLPPAAATPIAPRPQESAQPVAQRQSALPRWGWACVSLGAGALAGAGGIGLGISARNTAAEARRTMRSLPEYDQRASSAKTRSYLANGLFALSAVGIGTGVVLLVTDRHQAPESPTVSLLAGPGAGIQVVGSLP